MYYISVRASSSTDSTRFVPSKKQNLLLKAIWIEHFQTPLKYYSTLRSTQIYRYIVFQAHIYVSVKLPGTSGQDIG